VCLFLIFFEVYRWGCLLPLRPRNGSGWSVSCWYFLEHGRLRPQAARVCAQLLLQLPWCEMHPPPPAAASKYPFPHQILIIPVSQRRLWALRMGPLTMPSRLARYVQHILLFRPFLFQYFPRSSVSSLYLSQYLISCR
jgi:hypothetical protein